MVGDYRGLDIARDFVSFGGATEFSLEGFDTSAAIFEAQMLQGQREKLRRSLAEVEVKRKKWHLLLARLLTHFHGEGRHEKNGRHAMAQGIQRSRRRTLAEAEGWDEAHNIMVGLAWSLDGNLCDDAEGL